MTRTSVGMRYQSSRACPIFEELALGKQAGLIGVIVRKAQDKIQDPAKLRRLPRAPS